MWNTSNSKVILKWDQVHALENESEVTGYKVKLRLCLLSSLDCDSAKVSVQDGSVAGRASISKKN